jgi:hypothetical protein
VDRIERLTGGVPLGVHYDRYLRAAVAATKWLEAQNPQDLLGDDSVGWWLLLYAGRQIPWDVRERLVAQLGKVLPTIEIGRSTLYTATALARTLARAGLLAARNTVVSSLEDAITSRPYFERVDTASQQSEFSLDAVWLIQALYELGALNSRQTVSTIRSLIEPELQYDAIKFSMLWPIINRCMSPKQLKKICHSIDSQADKLISAEWLRNRLHWEVSYLLLMFIDRGLRPEAQAVATYLVDQQRDSQWDEATDENIESTSLVGLSMCAYWRFTHMRALTRDVEGLVESCLGLLIRTETGKDQTVEDKWVELKTTESPAIKGRAFEEFMTFYVSGDPTLTFDGSNQRTQSEEIDLVLQNNGTRLQGRQILVECKFTRKKTSASEVRDFCMKVQNRNRLFCNVGVIASMAGFTKDAKTELFRLNASRQGIIIGAITRADLELAVMQHRSLSELIEASLLAASKE